MNNVKVDPVSIVTTKVETSESMNSDPIQQISISLGLDDKDLI